MPLLMQKWIKREDLRMNPQVLYVFGDNVQRVGLGGQAKEMRGEENALGVATKYSPASYFIEQPQAVIAQNRIIDEDLKRAFEHVSAGGVLIWPTDGIGTGLSDLPRQSPSTWEYVEDKLAALIRAAKTFDTTFHLKT